MGRFLFHRGLHLIYQRFRPFRMPAFSSEAFLLPTGRSAGLHLRKDLRVSFLP
jgi:hypothetical protein